MPKIHLSMRIDQDVKLQLDDAAKNQNRTTANLIEWLFKQYLEQVAKGSTSATAPVAPDFASTDGLLSALRKRRPAIADTLHYLEDK